MSIAFDPVRTADDRQRLAALADEIWHEYWPALIGDAQTDYMVENFQSLEAIERDMREHAYEYWFMRAEDDGRIAGYTGGRVEPETNRFFISKVYLRAEERGKGFASRAIAFYERLCLERGLDAMYRGGNRYRQRLRHGRLHHGEARRALANGAPSAQVRELARPLRARASCHRLASARTPTYRCRHPCANPPRPHLLQQRFGSVPRIWHEFTVRALICIYFAERMASATA